jgi:hypothetical protein
VVAGADDRGTLGGSVLSLQALRAILLTPMDSGVEGVHRPNDVLSAGLPTVGCAVTTVPTVILNPGILTEGYLRIRREILACPFVLILTTPALKTGVIRVVLQVITIHNSECRHHLHGF